MMKNISNIDSLDFEKAQRDFDVFINGIDEAIKPYYVDEHTGLTGDGEKILLHYVANCDFLGTYKHDSFEIIRILKELEKKAGKRKDAHFEQYNSLLWTSAGYVLLVENNRLCISVASGWTGVNYYIILDKFGRPSIRG